MFHSYNILQLYIYLRLHHTVTKPLMRSYLTTTLKRKKTRSSVFSNKTCMEATLTGVTVQDLKVCRFIPKNAWILIEQQQCKSIKFNVRSRRSLWKVLESIMIQNVKKKRPWRFCKKSHLEENASRAPFTTLIVYMKNRFKYISFL